MITDAELNRLLVCCREVTTHADAPIEAKIGALSMMLDPLVIDVRRIANAVEKLANPPVEVVMGGHGVMGPGYVGPNTPYGGSQLQPNTQFVDIGTHYSGNAGIGPDTAGGK